MKYRDKLISKKKDNNNELKSLIVKYILQTLEEHEEELIIEFYARGEDACIKKLQEILNQQIILP